MAKPNEHARGCDCLKRCLTQTPRKAARLGRSASPEILAAVRAGLLLAGSVLFPIVLLGQTAETPSAPAAETAPPEGGGVQKTRKTYPVRSGSVTYGRIEESERRTTPDGEVATERVRMPSWSGDRRVMMEREVRTKKLPDGTVEKEYVLKNPDGADRLVPIEIIRERIKKSGDATTVEREVFKPDFQGHWKPTRRETVSETGGDTAKQSVQEIREPTVTGEWKVVDR